MHLPVNIHRRIQLRHTRLIILICYTVCLVVQAFFHSATYDELQAWMIAVTGSPLDIYRAMAVEGHFCLWHFLLYPFAKAGLSSAIGLPLVSISLMVVAAWWLLYKSPFGTLTNTLILASLPMAYYFPVISRCYALIPLLLWLTAYWYTRRSEHPIAYGVCIGLLINTHLYMEGLTMALMALWAWEIFRMVKRQRRQQIFGWLLAFVFGLIALSQVVGTFFISNTPAFVKTQTLPELIDCYINYIEPPLSYVSVYLGGGNATATAIISALFLISLFVFFAWVAKWDITAVGIALFSIVYQILFALYGYTCLWQRTYLPILVMLFALWIVNAPGKRVCWFAGVLFALCIAMHIYWLQGDIQGPESKYLITRTSITQTDPQLLMLPQDSYHMQIVYKCYGTDTIDAPRYHNRNDIYRVLAEKKPQRMIIYTSQHYSKSADYKKQLLDSAKMLGYDNAITLYTNLMEENVTAIEITRVDSINAAITPPNVTAK